MKWLFAILFLVGAHFGASYLVPLDYQSQQTFWGLLKWVWPWADGDRGPLGVMTTASGFPLTGFFLAVIAAALFLMAALAVLHWWVPFSWWHFCAGAGAAVLFVLLLLFFGPTKILPMAFCLFVLWAAWTNWSVLTHG
ncbi:MAG TPA: hypothetical protein VHA30_02745 [Patescibacteria group bacterium]|nr:hypothetical protein [Patescibacteria group bacterium]